MYLYLSTYSRLPNKYFVSFLKTLKEYYGRRDIQYNYTPWGSKLVTNPNTPFIVTLKRTLQRVPNGAGIAILFVQHSVLDLLASSYNMYNTLPKLFDKANVRAKWISSQFVWSIYLMTFLSSCLPFSLDLCPSIPSCHIQFMFTEFYAELR